ncbi:MAG TPA: phosphoadenylyl-sulfate reductase [Burkholderiaceae bacterium]|nr:phosphoadenylyl-sulfate reductase [Burkholderiaceae bacterium]
MTTAVSATVSALPEAVSELPGAVSSWPGADAAPLRKATELNARPSATYADKLAATEALLRQAATDFTTPDGQVQVVQAHSLGAEDVVVAHILQRLNLPIAAFVLETGALHAETLALLERTRQAQPERLRVYQPQAEAVVQFVQRHGADAMYQSIELRKACCGVRKMEPLARALAGQRAWITGLRREQSGARADVPAIEPDRSGDVERTKFNPLADWTWGDVWHYIATHGVDYNPLHDRFFPSIGCAPCTRAISLGEDFRAGRWWWEDEAAKECGLHAKKA